MGLWNDFLVIWIKIYNLKGIKKYDRFYVIDFNFAKVHRNGPPLHLLNSITWSKRLGSRYGIPLWACGMIMLLSALKYITLKVVKNMTDFMSLILILRRFTEMGLLSIFKAHNLVNWTRISIWHIFMGL